MKVVGFVGVSLLGKGPFIANVVRSFRSHGWSVSAIKRAPDGFDLDRPGKASYVRREAGCRDVMLVGDRRLVLMHEFADDPPLPALLERLAPVDIVVAEGFRDLSVPTVEVCAASSGRRERWKTDPRIVALVCDTPLTSDLPRFAATDTAGLAAHIAATLGLQPRS